MKPLCVTIDDQPFTCTIEQGTQTTSVKVGDTTFEAQILGGSDGRQTVLLNGRVFDVALQQQQGRHVLTINGVRVNFTSEDAHVAELRKRSRDHAGGQAQKEIRAPMPGLVLTFLKKVGDAVKSGEGVAIVEAMKMENEIKSQDDGEIAEICVQENSAIEKGAVLARLA